MKNKRVCIHTLGCRVNMYESCSISEKLRENGCDVVKHGVSDYYIVNTCAVTAEAERKSRQLVRRCAAKGKVLVIGCASQLINDFSSIENVIYVGGNRNKSVVADIILGNVEFNKHSVNSMDGASYENMCISGKDDLFSECRAFVKIQDGCNGKCTYCIIPKCRGTVRSRDPEDVIDEVSRLVENGYSEIILTGIEVGAYNKISLYELIERVSSISGVKRLRLGSLSPNIINESFLKHISCLSNFMPHIHLSLQSCNDDVLADMKRPYRKKEIIDKIELIRKYIPSCMISADIIVGFPTEDDAAFLETVDTLEQLKVFHVHSFPYSERPGTPAAEMKCSVPRNIRNDRNNALINKMSEVKNGILNDLCGGNTFVLVEKVVEGKAFGHTEHFIEACFDYNGDCIGKIFEVKVISHDGNVLLCVPKIAEDIS